MSTIDQTLDEQQWYALDSPAVVAKLSVDPDSGLDAEAVERRLATYGPNQLTTEPPPSVWAIALGQLKNPMNIMLIIVAIASLAIGQVATGIFVALLVTFNLVMGSRQELKALASVDALAQLQVPHARVRRAGSVEQIEAIQLVPGDVVLLEAGEVVPADGRIVSSATLEVQEAALTGESAPVPKDAGTLPAGDLALGDRTNMVFQNTQVTRGTATVLVTATGQATQMGHIADMVTATKRVKSPLQQELDGLTKIFGLLAWTAVAIIAIFGIARGQDAETLALLCISTAISAIPVGLPTFVQTMLSSGAQHLAEDKAVVKSLTDVETLGGTTVINSDKTGTLTMNAMTATTMLADGQRFTIEGGGYTKTGAILGVAGGEVPDFNRLALGLVLSCDATVADDGTVIGDPTEAAFVVLAAKMGVDAEETRSALPRVAEVPFDSEYKFMATFHDRPDWMTAGVLDGPHFMTVKGAPDVVIDRCGYVLWNGQQVPIAERRDELLAANQKLSEQGLRVLSFAVRNVDHDAMATARTDPMATVGDLLLIALVGIIDPLRAEAKAAVRVALNAGVDVRMITGDHTVTARAIADELQLGPGVITGTELQQLSDAEVLERLPQLHVFGRVAPEDKVRLARLMQEDGQVVAMTGDAVNDAAALKQADIGVAMGSGSEVTQQAAKIVLTDDNFATLVRAVELGRDIYRRITSYVKLQLTVLSAVLQLMLLATIFNINGGVALFPMQLLFCKFFVVVTVVIGFIADVPDPSVMHRPPRKPGTRIVTPPQIVRWLVSGFIIAGLALVVLQWGPDQPSTDTASVSMTMAFAIVALSAVNLGVVMRRERESPLSAPIFPYFGWIFLGWVLTWAAVELNMLQRLLDTESLTGAQWLLVIAFSLVAPTVVGIDKYVQLARQNKARNLVGAEPAAPGIGELMSKKHKHEHGHEDDAVDSSVPGEPRPKMKNKEYQHELRGLHAELVAMQEWVKTFGAKVCVVFEGRDTAGKGGTIKAITERVSPRVFRVVALPAPTEREKSQMYIQRYIPHLPAGGEVVIFDRSWYNRAGVERVMGFCTDEQADRFLEQVPEVEKAMLDSGIHLIKYWLEVSADEQTRRLESRIDDPRKTWKLSGMDLASYTKWDDYSRARDAMFAATDTAWAPWYVARTDDKKRARLNIISHLLSHVPYEQPKHKKVTLPERVIHDDAPANAPEPRYIPTPF